MLIADLKGWARRRPTAFYIVFLCLLFVPLVPVSAHFLLSQNTRIMHIDHLSKGLRVYLRLPMPYLVANLVGPQQENGLPRPAPYTFNTREDGNIVYYLDVDALRADPDGLGEMVANSHHIVSEGATLPVSLEAIRVYPISKKPPFSTLAEARVSFQGALYPDDLPVDYIGDTVVDVMLLFDSDEAVASYALSSTLDPGLPGQEILANLILDYYPGGVEVFRAQGLLHEPFEITKSPLAAAITFVREGIRHILSGSDHVLFVICLALGAARFKALFLRTTGFTIGHSLTLSLGFYGFVPSGAWFVPAIETGIAISIIFAALAALRQRQGRNPPELMIFAVTTAIGILHGLGFSFVLHRVLQVDGPNVWQSLLSFNVGVEVGQVLIILVFWPVFRLLARLGARGWLAVRWSVAAPCIALAAYWTVQRTMQVIASV